MDGYSFNRRLGDYDIHNPKTGKINRTPNWVLRAEENKMEKKKTEANTPIMKVSIGGVKATAWNNYSIKNDEVKEYTSITLERVFKKDDNWGSTNTYRIDDIPKVIAVLNRVYSKLMIKEL